MIPDDFEPFDVEIQLNVVCKWKYWLRKQGDFRGFKVFCVMIMKSATRARLHTIVFPAWCLWISKSEQCIRISKVEHNFYLDKVPFWWRDLLYNWYAWISIFGWCEKAFLSFYRVSKHYMGCSEHCPSHNYVKDNPFSILKVKFDNKILITPFFLYVWDKKTITI